jgi:hypothetical protein
VYFGFKQFQIYPSPQTATPVQSPGSSPAPCSFPRRPTSARGAGCSWPPSPLASSPPCP